jgi:hypothetical protein
VTKLWAEIAALLNESSGEAEPSNLGPDRSEAWRGDGEPLERITLKGIQPESDNQTTRRKSMDVSRGIPKSVEIAGVGGTMEQWDV